MYSVPIDISISVSETHTMRLLYDTARGTRRCLFKCHVYYHRTHRPTFRVRLPFHNKPAVLRLISSCSPSLTTCGVDFTAYTSFTASSSDTGCTTSTTKISLSTPIFVPASSYTNNGDGSLNSSSAELFFFSYLKSTSCYSTLVSVPTAVPATGVVQASIFSSSFLQTATGVVQASIFSSSFLQTAVLLQPNPTLPPSSTGHTQNSSANMGETRKLIIGLVVAVIVPMLLVAMCLAYLSIARKRRRTKIEVALACQDDRQAEDEGEIPQLYLQRKVELDDEQRRHELEARELRYEIEGDEIHEIVGDEGKRHWGRQELRGEEHSKGFEGAL